jgi:hypothetical protein
MNILDNLEIEIVDSEEFGIEKNRSIVEAPMDNPSENVTKDFTRIYLR